MARLPMSTFRPRTHPQRRFAWLLWLALLLPLAQAASGWHVLSHGLREPDEKIAAQDKKAPPVGHCDQCLIAAAIGGGALPSPASFVPQSFARHESPSLVFATAGYASPAGIYRSRAPPLALP